MLKILVDINVILDVLLDRQPHVNASAAIREAIETGTAEGYLAAHAITTLHYLISRGQTTAKTRRTLESLLRIFRIATADDAVIREALQSPATDFEDAVSAACARAAHCDLIVTRDPRGFRFSAVRALTPEAALPLLQPKALQPKALQPEA